MSSKIQELKNIFEKANQGHVFKYYNQLSAKDQASLVEQLSQINPERLNLLFKNATSPESGNEHPIEPLTDSQYDSVLKNSKDQVRKWEDTGLEAIAKGEVGIILLAGGQGTRLGSSDPKGCYDIGLPSHKSLFQVQAERIARLQHLSQIRYSKQVNIPWYVMTSKPTSAPTQAFFEKNNFFGLNPKNVIFFNQGTLPCLSKDGKILLEDKSNITMAPDGNGGIYPSLRLTGMLQDMEKRGIKYLHAYCVDNCLVKVCDPIFVGYCISKGSDFGAKVIPKSHPKEGLGLICNRGSKLTVIEYSELSDELAHKTNRKGQLAFNSGNICNHFYTLGFLNKMEQIEKSLKYHVAHKKVKCVDLNSDKIIKPSEPNGIKLESFIFDIISYAQNVAILEVDRTEEFSPLKNAPGTKSDNPETCKRDILQFHAKLIKNAGGIIKNSNLVELSPLVTYNGEGLETLKGAVIHKDHLSTLNGVGTLKAKL